MNKDNISYKKIRDITDKEIQINSCLQSIEEPCEVTSKYLKDEYEVNDKNELIYALEAVIEYCDDIRNILAEITCAYRKEVEEHE